MPKKVSQESRKKDVQERWTSDGMTQEEVAEVLGMKRQTVNNIEKMALRKLRYIISKKHKREDLL